MKVVIPAAGLGTRFLPATKSMPKEMLPVLRKPVIQYVVEEAIEAGADDIAIVTGLLKRALEDHFDHNPELGAADDLPEVRSLDALSARATFHFIRQRAPRGLGNAILAAERHVGREPFGVLLGDSIHVCDPPLLLQLLRTSESMGGRSSVVALEMIPEARVQHYGIVGGSEVAPGVVDIDRFVEKPSPSEAPSHRALTGVYWFTPTIFDFLRELSPGPNGEVQLTDALNGLLRREKVYGLMFSGRRYDTGTPIKWLEANLRFAWNHPEYGETIQELVRELQDMGVGKASRPGAL